MIAVTNIGTLFQILFLSSLSLVSLNKKANSTHYTFNDLISQIDTIKSIPLSNNESNYFKDTVMTIVIDAGHGGHDTGCQGENSIEKDITLKIGLAVGKYLEEKCPDVKVVHTRTTDCFVALHERIGLAQRIDAELFISIHSNAFSDEKVHGTELYVMGLHSAKENLEVAKRENASIKLEHGYQKNYDGFDPDSPEGQIILSMFQNIHLEKSIDFAYRISSQVSRFTGLKNRGIKQAGFVILKNATMPSILIETGFLSNERDERILLSPEGQNSYAKSIGDAIISYKKEMDNEKVEPAISK